jgi:hypothetical protein
MDLASIAAFSKWRFYPGQFKIVWIPITYTAGTVIDEASGRTSKRV